MHHCIKFILLWNDTLHVSNGLSVHHREFKTVHTATCVCQTDTAVCLLASTRPKHVEFHSKIKCIWYIGASSWFYYKNTANLLLRWTTV